MPPLATELRGVPVALMLRARGEPRMVRTPYLRLRPPETRRANSGTEHVLGHAPSACSKRVARRGSTPASFAR